MQKKVKARAQQIRKRFKKWFHMMFLVFLLFALSGCATTADGSLTATQTPSATKETGQNAKPALPEKLKLNEEGVPVLSVYQVDEEAVAQMDLEEYLQGVLAGEMKNDWPIEALKAQAILARTFVLKFCTEKESKYGGADISTDIEEAQAYDATGINENIVLAVKQTQGEVLSHNGELPYAWFHAHSGGMTALAKEGLDYEKDEPGYTKVTQGMDSDKAPEDAKAWTAQFSIQELAAAVQETGISLNGEPESISIAERGESGRAVRLKVNDALVSAPQLRIALGSSKMRSTLLTSLTIENGNVKMAGKGYGHGVGMPQWGAYFMADEGKSAEEIVTYYFHDVTVEKLW